MKTKLYDTNAQEIGTVLLPKDIFDVAINPVLLRHAVAIQEANARVIRAHTKGRGEVSGGGRKPWRQKGTGRARHGSIRSPLWRGGGVAHGPRKEKRYSKKINKKAKRKALCMALSSKAADGELYVLDSLQVASGKTKEAKSLISKFLEKAKLSNPSVLVITSSNDKSLVRSMRNIPRVKTIGATSLNVRDILKYKLLLMPKDALKVIQETYASNKAINK